MKNSADLGGYYPPWPSASVDNASINVKPKGEGGGDPGHMWGI